MSITNTLRNLWDEVSYEPHEAQWLIHESDARFKVPCCGRRFGKSTSAIGDLWEDFLIPNSTHWLVGPTYELGEREFEQLVLQLQNFKSLYNKCDISYSPIAGNMKVKFPWNALVKVVSAEKPKSLQGKGLSSAVMCEAGEHDPLTWSRYIRPALSDKRGRAIFPSTPKGYNWYYDFWRRGNDPAPEYSNWASWQFPTWANTKVFSGPDDPEIVEMRNTMSDVLYRQEVCAEFTSFEGKVYAEFDEKRHVCDLTEAVGKYLPFWRNFWGVDFGFRDPFVCLDIMVDPEDNVYVWREYYKDGLPTIIHCDRLRQRKQPKGYHVDGIFADPSGADGVATMEMKIGQVWHRRVEPMQAIEQLKVLMNGVPLPSGEYKQRFFVDHSCQNLIRELNTFQIKRPRVLTPKETFEHTHSHSPDALRYFAGEYFVLGAGSHLQDVYKYARHDLVSSSGETLFKLQPKERMTMSRIQF